MNLHQLNVFRAIVDTGSFSRAASRLHIAQSAVSYHIKALEIQIGKPLFLRYKTQVLLTEKGRRLWEHVQKIFEAVDAAQMDLCGDSGEEARELHFGLGVSSLTERLPAFTREFREVCPRVCFNVAMGSTPQIIALLRTKALDLGVVSLPVAEPEVETTSLFYEEEEMLVVISKDHKLGERKELAPGDLQSLPLILYQKSTSTRASLDTFFREAGIAPVIFMELNREDAILELVRGGLGATILPRCVFGHRAPDEHFAFLRLSGAYLRREVGIALVKPAHRSKIVETAIALCRKHFAGEEKAKIPEHPIKTPILGNSPRPRSTI